MPGGPSAAEQVMAAERFAHAERSQAERLNALSDPLLRFPPPPPLGAGGPNIPTSLALGPGGPGSQQHTHTHSHTHLHLHPSAVGE